MHDPELQESQFGADEETPGQTGAPSEQEREHAELDQTQLGTDDQLPIEDTPALGREQETIGSATKAKVVRTGLVGEKVDEPTQQQTQLDTRGITS